MFIINDCHDLYVPCTVTGAIRKRSMQVTKHIVAAGCCMGYNTHNP